MQDEFLALQQGVTNKQKLLQQRVNRLEQEVSLPGKASREILPLSWYKRAQLISFCVER